MVKEKHSKRIQAFFYRQESGNEPVRDWLLSLDNEDKKVIGDDIRTAEYGWPIGMPVCKQLRGRKGMYEIRSSLKNGRIARVFFCVLDKRMVLLHGIIKKTQKTPANDLVLAENRMKGMS